MAKAKLVYATATEDLDALTFGTPVLLRHLTSALVVCLLLGCPLSHTHARCRYSAARKVPVAEIHLEQVLTDIGISMEQVCRVSAVWRCRTW